MDIFKGQEIIEFSKRFQNDLDCKEYLSELKWASGYKCRRCGHHLSQVRIDYSRTCNKCSDTESPGADALFHKVKFGLLKAFHICFEMSTTSKSFSALQVARRYGIRPETARTFMHKVREAMKSSGSKPMKGEVHVDEFVIGGRDSERQGRSYGGKKKKVVCAVELTDKGKVKRFYAMKIMDFSAKSLRPIFERHISVEAKVTTYEWKVYRPLTQDYNITQQVSQPGLNFNAIHTMIHQVKSWIRTIFTWVSKRNIDRYMNEFSYRNNRSQTKETIFHNLITRMVNADKLYVQNIL